MRPRRLVVIAGTGTEVGKTWVTDQLARHLVEAGASVLARKPVQSFSPDDTVTDADVLAGATGESPHDVCPAHRWYPLAMAPPMAAEALALPVPFLDELVTELAASWPDHQPGFGLVETAGGIASPVAADADNARFARAIDAEVAVLVADAGLGTISAVRLAVPALDPIPTVVYLNRFDPKVYLHRANLDWLRTHDGLTLVTGPAALLDLVTA